MSYSKLHSSIVNSSLWGEEDHVRLLFITMLAMCDKDGIVYGSRLGIERAAMITYTDDDRNPWQVLMSEDKDSSDKIRAPENGGRRIEEISGGFRLLNFSYYRGLRNDDDRREQNRAAQERHRKSARISQGQPPSAAVSHDKPISEAEAEAEAIKGGVGVILENSTSREPAFSEAWKSITEFYGGLCAYCQSQPWVDIDHFIPTSRGGTHSPGNVVPACKSCNSSKKNALPEGKWSKIRRHPFMAPVAAPTKNQSLDVEIPEPLRTMAFMCAWKEWKTHRSQKRGKLTPLSAKKQLDRLEKMGSARAVAAINYSIEKGWVGLFEPDAATFGKQQSVPIYTQKTTLEEKIKSLLMDKYIDDQWVKRPKPGFEDEVRSLREKLREIEAKIISA